MAFTSEYIGMHPKYKGVQIRKTKDGELRYVAKIANNSKTFYNERSAAMCYDLWRINNGKNPINILTRK